MGLEGDGRTIRWRVHLRTPPDRVYGALATATGRERFWASSATEEGGTIAFQFGSGQTLRSRVLERDPPTRFALTYFGDSRVRFDLAPDGAGGTDLSLTETGVPAGDVLDNLAGWVSVLLALKAAVDFGVDLRNSDPARRWEDGYVDV
jgi:uncharacterized protein YndB with AHSA1/START domain